MLNSIQFIISHSRNIRVFLYCSCTFDSWFSLRYISYLTAFHVCYLLHLSILISSQLVDTRSWQIKLVSPVSTVMLIPLLTSNLVTVARIFKLQLRKRVAEMVAKFDTFKPYYSKRIVRGVQLSVMTTFDKVWD